MENVTYSARKTRKMAEEKALEYKKIKKKGHAHRRVRDNKNSNKLLSEADRPHKDPMHQKRGRTGKIDTSSRMSGYRHFIAKLISCPKCCIGSIYRMK